METWARRWLPWMISWTGWTVMIFHAGVLGTNRGPWMLAFLGTLGVSIAAGATRLRGAMNLLVAVVVVVGCLRSYQYAQLEAWNPAGVWAIVIGTHLTMWSAVPFHSVVVAELDCQRADNCPRRIPVIVSGRRR